MALLYFFAIFSNRTIREEFNMKVTNEEKIIIRFLKNERNDAKVREMKERERLIARLKQGPCELTNFQDYIDAVSDFYAMNGTYGAYVDEIVTRFKNEIRYGKS